MTTRELLSSAWDWNLCVIAICAVALAAHVLLWQRRSLFHLGCLAAGLLVLFLTLCSPIDTLADGYLFSAHMLQHLLLLLIVPALMLLGIPSMAIPDRFEKGNWTWLNGVLRRPLLTWLCGVGGMWFWHAPLLCNAAVRNVWIHQLQYVSLIGMGVVFWWPIIGPWKKQRLPPLLGMIYLFAACAGCTILGIIIVFAPVGVCSIYLHPVDRLGVLPLIQGGWGLTPEKDQQLAGLLMWVPACLIYLVGIFGLFARWHGAAQEKEKIHD